MPLQAPLTRNAAPPRLRLPGRMPLRLVRACAALALFLAGSVVAQDEAVPRLQVTSNVAERYAPGTEHDLNMRLSLVDPNADVAEAVLFLNVIEVNEEGTYPQAMHRVFASAETSETVFRRPLDGDTLRAGVEATVHVRLRDRVPPGTYAFVIQLFAGSQTDPHDVQVEDRVAMHTLRFEVVGENAAQ